MARSQEGRGVFSCKDRFPSRIQTDSFPNRSYKMSRAIASHPHEIFWNIHVCIRVFLCSDESMTKSSLNDQPTLASPRRILRKIPSPFLVSLTRSLVRPW